MSTTKTDFPIIVLSVVMMISGTIMGFAVAGLPSPTVDQGFESQLGLFGFAAIGLGFGAGLFRTGLWGRTDRLSFGCFAFGFAGFLAASIAAIINHLASQALGL